MAIGAMTPLGTFKYGPTVNSLVNFREVWGSKLMFKPILDTAQRTVKWIQVDLECSGYLAATGVGITTDDEFEELRRLLTTPGGILEFEDRGTGALNVNKPGERVKDLNFGPIPKILTWKPVGADKACMVTWQCTTCIPDMCDNPRFKGLVSVNYDAAFTVEDDGLSTVTYTGSAEIAMAGRSVDGRELNEVADQHWEKLIPAIPLGFNRETNNRRVDSSKRMLTWNVSYKQLPYPFPKGLTAKSRVNHKVRSDISRGFMKWDHSISGTLVFPPRTPKSDMISRIMLIAFSRLLQKPKPGHKPGEFILPSGARSLIITSLEVDDPLWENRLTFNINASTVGASLNEILTRSGLFSPVPGSSFKEWATSLENLGVSGPRGTARLVLRPDDDLILDACTNEPPRTPRLFPQNLTQDGPAAIQPGKNEDIKEEESWVFYECSARLEFDQLYALAKAVAAGGMVAAGPAAAALEAVAKAAGISIKGYITGLKAAVNASLTAVGNPTCRCVVKGRAIRLQHPIVPPKVTQIGNVKVGDGENDAKLQRMSVSPLKKGGFGNVSLHYLSWELVFMVPRLPGGDASIPANPALKLEGDGPK